MTKITKESSWLPNIVFVVVIATLIALFLGIASKLTELMRYRWNATPWSTSHKEDFALFSSIPNNFTSIEYYDWMPTPWVIESNGWNQPNFWARFPYWTERKQEEATHIFVHDTKPTRISDGLYLGSIGSQLAKHELKRHGITHILEWTIEILPMFPDDFTYMTLNNLKEPGYPLLDDLPQVFEYIKSAHDAGGAVMISWFFAENRSVSVLLSYLMNEYHWTLYTATTYLSGVAPKRNIDVHW